MGYNLTIGEAHVDGIEEYDKEDAREGIYLRVEAESVSHDEAPAFNEPTDNSNQRWPSYSAWADFTEESGLEEFMYDGRNFKGGHPGAFALVAEDVDTVFEAVTRMRDKYPAAADAIDNGVKYDDSDNAHQVDGFGFVARATWLHYWVKWSVENCNFPVLANS